MLSWLSIQGGDSRGFLLRCCSRALEESGDRASEVCPVSRLAACRTEGDS